jgi:Protein of unknwon function (DUF3310)
MSLPPYNDTRNAAQIPYHEAQQRIKGFNEWGAGAIAGGAGLAIGGDIGRQQRQDQSNPLEVQVGGGHYKGKAIQPVEFISANNLNFLEGCIVKRITRWRDKNGIEDLQKIKHEVDLLIAMEQKYGNAGK